VRRAVLAALPAALIAYAVGLSLPSSVEPAPVVPPARCSWVSHDGNYSEFCIRYIPALGRYEDPPQFVPADFARLYPPGVDAEPHAFRATVAVILFALLFVGLSAVLRIVSRRQPG
jgi:hypothetical protein